MRIVNKFSWRRNSIARFGNVTQTDMSRRTLCSAALLVGGASTTRQGRDAGLKTRRGNVSFLAYRARSTSVAFGAKRTWTEPKPGWIIIDQFRRSPVPFGFDLD